ncbi:ankyrin repeat domain-containing protein [Sporosarcina sp. Te-1]|uniref:ankyrin repeat domain-containing protein n=1 Tax=Sporosarcina sp. Te-1 TaxID=2818390 RepID=UPI001A9DB141|nr:ankyrin repeat domain-containing protein [Sporosarcina sp. Te-1]QTD43001.1 ankyrin repeat domain-containing protein [Sporosarcina sp. Te-1]
MEQRLISAAAEGDTETVLELIEDGADIDGTDHQGVTAVMAATQRNNVNMVKTLIEHGADIDIRNHNLDNVLLYAGAEGFIEIVQLAVEAGADTTITNRYGGIALIPASERGHVDVVEELLTNSDTDVNHINNLHWTALLEAIILGNGGKTHQKIVQLLVDHGADVNIRDRDGVTPLEHAERRGFKEIEHILKEAGA